MEDVERTELLSLLEQWQKGAVNERDVHQQAEHMLEQVEGDPTYQEHDPRSIALEVLFHLDVLNQQLIIRDDIPAIQTFLLTPSGKETEGWALWRKYWDELDVESRRKELKTNPYYCT